MRQIVYFSTAADRQDAITFAAILAVSRAHNRRDKVTGLLIAGGHRYLQILEGATDVVEAAMGRIGRDQRHLGVTILVDRRIRARGFAGWSMAFCEQPQLSEFATLGTLVGQLQAQVSDNKLREQIDCFARSFVIVPPPLAAASRSSPLSSPWTLASDYHEKLTFDRSH